MNARVKNLKLQAKAATMIMAPRNASALECVVATKPLPVRLLSSVGVRREGRASRPRKGAPREGGAPKGSSRGAAGRRIQSFAPTSYNSKQRTKRRPCLRQKSPRV